MISPRERFADRLIEIDIGGESHPWYPTIGAAEIARNQGENIGDLLFDLDRLGSELRGSEVTREQLQSIQGLMSAISRLCWYGLLTFDPDIPLRDVQLLFSHREISELPLERMMREISMQEDPQAPDVEDTDGVTSLVTSGKAPSAAGNDSM